MIVFANLLPDYFAKKWHFWPFLIMAQQQSEHSIWVCRHACLATWWKPHKQTQLANTTKSTTKRVCKNRIAFVTGFRQNENASKPVVCVCVFSCYEPHSRQVTQHDHGADRGIDKIVDGRYRENRYWHRWVWTVLYDSHYEKRVFLLLPKTLTWVLNNNNGWLWVWWLPLVLVVASSSLLAKL